MERSRCLAFRVISGSEAGALTDMRTRSTTRMRMSEVRSMAEGRVERRYEVGRMR